MAEEAIPQKDVLSRPLHITVWRSMFPREAFGGITSLRGMAQAIKTRHALSKEELWWLKLARFGDQPNEKGYLRHNENLLEIEGLEADYDAKKMSVDQAVEIAEKAGLACVIYTSPSHTDEEPKWRILAPFFEPLDPAQRDHLMGRLNGLYGGIFDPASWTLSQSYYYGYVDGNEASHRVELVDGEPIDELHELDQIWMPKPLRAAKFSDNTGHDSAYRRHAEQTELDLDAVIEAILSGANFHNALLSLAGHLFGKGYEREEVFDHITRVMEQVDPLKRDRRWKLRSSPRHINGILDWVGGRENKKLFKRLREQEGREDDARTAPEPEAEPQKQEEARAPGSDTPPPEGKEKPEKKQTATNAMTLRRAMTRYPEMANIFAFDDFAHRMMVLKPIPDPDRKSNAPFTPRAWEDTDETRLAIWFQSIGYLKASAALAFAVADLVAKDNRFHPVRDYLDTLEWDGAPRCGELFRRGFGALAEDRVHEQYLLDIGRCWMISAIARVMDPGCKVDTMPILEGPQGAMKSSGVRALAPEPEWFSDTMPSDLDAKDARQHLPGKWLVEMSEISQLRKSEVESLKSFLSTQTDKYRPSYGRTEVSRHRQSVFVGTTNEDAYFSDATGNRRFWPVKVGKVDLKWIRDHRDQLWAEALFLYRQNEKWWLDGETAAYAEEQQKERLVDDEWDAVVASHVGGRSQVTVSEILSDAFHLDKAMHDKQQQMRVTTSLRKLGFKRVVFRDGDKTARKWTR